MYMLMLQQDKRLRLALLDYLERYHKEDTETYTMVALHFAMYRQIAVMLQAKANALLLQLDPTAKGEVFS